MNSSTIDQTRILILDDYPDLLDVINALFSTAGYQPISTTSGEIATDIMEQLSPSLLILDMNLPNFDCCQFIESVRSAKSSIKDIPILLFTAMPYPEIAKGLRSGANDFLRKPSSAIEILTKVEALTKVEDYSSKVDLDNSDRGGFFDNFRYPGSKFVPLEKAEDFNPARSLVPLLL
jgi:DNA-binding response OmpR family regulator